MSNKNYIPKPIFDTIEEIINQYKNIRDSDNPQHVVREWFNLCFADLDISIPSYAFKDFQSALNFLYSYRGSHDTFVAYRRDLERFLQWSWFVREHSVLKHRREDIEAFIEFCLKPPKRWIGLKKVAKFKETNGKRVSNPEWRPFEARISKQDHKKGGKEPDKSN